MPAAELVDAVEVVRRDDEAVELAQVTLVCILQAVHAVIVHGGLTPYTPVLGTEKPVRREQKPGSLLAAGAGPGSVMHHY